VRLPHLLSASGVLPHPERRLASRLFWHKVNLIAGGNMSEIGYGLLAFSLAVFVGLVVFTVGAETPGTNDSSDLAR
jgi:uncharacterized membrane protein